MSDALRPLRVNAVEMLRQPGAVRSIATTIDPAAVDVAHEQLAGEITIDLDLESTHDSITVRGALRTPWAGRCRRCLRELAGIVVADVDERYQQELTDDDAFLIEANQLDLVPVVRQAVLLELDTERLCDDDSAGLCPVCGVDRNDEACHCVVDVRDLRWAALDGIILDE